MVVLSTCYTRTHIKRGLTRPANLQLVQGGIPEREMWPKGNIERQPSTDKPLEGFVMQDDDHIYNAMHSDEITDGDTSMQNRHNSPVHGPERRPSILDLQAVGLETTGRY